MILTREEIETITGKQRRDAQRRVLSHLGIDHKVRPDGSLVVRRDLAQEALGPVGKIARPRPQLRP